MTDDDKSQLGSRVAPDDEIRSLKTAAGAATDAELASLIGVKPSAVAQWRRRGRVPDKARFRVQNLTFEAGRERRALTFMASQPAEVVLYARALAIAFTAKPQSGPADPERLRQLALGFEEICAATAVLLTVRMRDGATAWEAFNQALASQFLWQDVHETWLGGGLAGLRSIEQQGPSDAR